MNVKSVWDLKATEEMNKILNRSQKHFPIINNENELENTAAFFKALGDETRLKIMTLLWFEDLCMCEIVDGLSGATSTISHHLKIMEKGKMIKSRREGKFTIYSLDKERLAPLLPYIKEGEENV